MYPSSLVCACRRAEEVSARRAQDPHPSSRPESRGPAAPFGAASFDGGCLTRTRMAAGHSGAGRLGVAARLKSVGLPSQVCFSSRCALAACHPFYRDMARTRVCSPVGYGARTLLKGCSRHSVGLQKGSPQARGGGGALRLGFTKQKYCNMA